MDSWMSGERKKTIERDTLFHSSKCERDGVQKIYCHVQMKFQVCFYNLDFG